MLTIKDLVKKYGKFVAVDNLNLEVEKGQIFGFVGPNGAGKTTTMKIIATLLEPTSGQALVDGIDVIKDPMGVRSKLGYMPDFFGVYDNLKVTEYLDFYGSSYGMSYANRKKSANELLELVELSHKKDSYVDELSRGMKQRLCLARSLIHNPELLILDEPASGMDPRARVEMMSILKQLKQMNKTILISSHILHELSELCDIIGIIDDGKLVTQGRVEEIMTNVTGRKVLKIRILDLLDKAINILKQHPMVLDILNEGNVLQVVYDGEDNDIWRVLKTLVDNEIPVVSFNKGEDNLEKIFMEVTRDYEAK